MLIKKFDKTVSHREKFLLILIYSYLVLTSLALLGAILSPKNLVNISIEVYLFVMLGKFILVFYTLYHFKKYGEFQFAAVLILWIASLNIMFNIYMRNYNIDIIYAILIPIIAAPLLSRKNLIRHGILFFILLIALFIYGYYAYPQHQVLHNPWLFVNYVILVIFMLNFAIIYHIFIEHHTQEMEISNKQKDFLLKEIHHRVKNNLNMISSILGLQKREDKPEITELLESNRKRIDSIAIVHELLYDGDEFEQIDAKVYVDKLVNHLIYACASSKIETEIKIRNISLTLETIIHLGLLMQELLTNSLKHALTKGGKIYISIEKKDKEFIFTYQDSGIFSKKSSIINLGLELIDLKIRQLKAKRYEADERPYFYKISFLD